MDKLISVVIPVYNVEEYLGRCVESVLGQTYGNVEILLVDDGSPDGSGAICDAYAARDARVRVIHKENGGLSSARNIAIDQAQGDYLAFVDSDDYLEPDACAHLLATAERWDAPMVCGGRYDVDWATGARSPGLCPEAEGVVTGEEFTGRMFTWDGCDSAAWDKLYRRELFRGIRYPQGLICEDVPTTYRLALAAGRVALTNRRVYNYFHRPGSITTAAISDKSFHLVRHTAAILPEIQANHPDIAPQARYLRVRSLEQALLLLELGRSEAREQYRSQSRALRRDLRRSLVFILRYPKFHRRDRLRDLLLALGLYRFFRPYFTHAIGEQS